MVAQQGTGNQLQLLIVILPEVSGSYGKHTTTRVVTPLLFIGFFVVYLTLLLLQEKLKESVRLKLVLYLNVACQSMLAGQTSNI